MNPTKSNTLVISDDLQREIQRSRRVLGMYSGWPTFFRVALIAEVLIDMGKPPLLTPPPRETLELLRDEKYAEIGKAFAERLLAQYNDELEQVVNGGCVTRPLPSQTTSGQTP